ncbi:MAG: hypothetical protein ACOCY0_05840 [Roseicyclus sp.]
MPGDPTKGDGLWFEAAKAAHRERQRLGTFGAASEGRRIDPAELSADELARYLGKEDSR